MPNGNYRTSVRAIGSKGKTVLGTNFTTSFDGIPGPIALDSSGVMTLDIPKNVIVKVKASLNDISEETIVPYGTRLVKLKLPINQEIDMNKKTEKLLAFAFGVIFVSIILTLAVIIEEPSEFQIQIFRVVLALAGAGVAATFTGFLNVTVNNWVKAGGALAVFIVIFFFLPGTIGQG
jgi:hypothetical protein